MRATILISFLFFGVCTTKAIPVGHGTSTADTFGPSDVLDKVCKDLLPIHPNPSGEPHEPQQGKFPYVITANVKKIKPLEKVQVTISGIEGATFKGFMTQARNGDRVYGKFERSESVGLIDCLGSKENTATTRVHVDRNDKNSVVLTWVAPKDLPEYVEFVTTIVKDYSTFWVGQKSEKIYTTKSN